jgi:hypothetical protein
MFSPLQGHHQTNKGYIEQGYVRAFSVVLRSILANGESSTRVTLSDIYLCSAIYMIMTFTLR